MATPNLPSEYPNLALIRQGIDYRFNIQLRNLRMRVRPLSVMEEDQVVQETMAELVEISPDLRTSLKESILLTIKKLALATTSDVGKNDGSIHPAELAQFTPGELDALFKQYVKGCEQVNPTFEKMGAEKVKKMVEELKKNSTDTETTLIGLSFFQLVEVCLHLIREGSPTGN